MEPLTPSSSQDLLAIEKHVPTPPPPPGCTRYTSGTLVAHHHAAVSLPFVLQPRFHLSSEGELFQQVRYGKDVVNDAVGHCWWWLGCLQRHVSDPSTNCRRAQPTKRRSLGTLGLKMGLHLFLGVHTTGSEVRLGLLARALTPHARATH